ncbi:MAG: ABC transporter ATP-binding protein [Clostridiales bacterium]|nr:ABC transporter ATP-binding protein [Clostridiales bacterium]MDD6937201.1 ABC transporter ATP-binding protein [Clostridiales bacterium]
MEQPAQIITVADLKKYYTVGPNTVKALDGVSLDVKSGEFVGVMGRSGSGKSTLLNMLAGLESPTDGFLEIDGEPVGILSERKRIQFRRNSIGFVFQSYNLMPQYTTLENVALPLAIRGVSKRVRDELAEEALYRVGLQDNLRHRPSELSGGEQQRVGIARAIIAKPPIVLADEPTGNLDTKTSDEVMQLLTELFREEKTTFVLVTHDPEMRRYMDRTICLRDGRLSDTI